MSDDGDIEYQHTEDYRQTCCESINEFIHDNVKTKIIERSIFNSTITKAISAGLFKSWTNCKFVRLYVDAIRVILENLDPDGHVNNTYLLPMILNLSNEELMAFNIGDLSHEKLFPARWEQVLKERDERNHKTFEYVAEGSDSYRCKRCGARKTASEFVQTRSADEPMTQFVKCLECGASWRM